MAKMRKTDLKLKEIMTGANIPQFGQLNWCSANFDVDYMLALNYLNEMVEPSELLREAQRLLAGREDALRRLTHMNWGAQVTVGKIAYCINRGAQLSERSRDFVERALSLVKLPEVKEIDSAELGFEDLEGGTSARNVTAYVNCYSQIDNLKARVLKGGLELSQLRCEVEKLVDRVAGGRRAVRSRLLEHYTLSVEEAKRDGLRTWARALREIIAALGGVSKPARKVSEPGKTVPLAEETKSKPEAKAVRKLAAEPKGKSLSKGKRHSKEPSRSKGPPKPTSSKISASKISASEGKLFTIGGTARFGGEISYRLASGDIRVRIATLLRCGASDVQLQPLPKPMTRQQALKYLGQNS